MQDSLPMLLDRNGVTAGKLNRDQRESVNVFYILFIGSFIKEWPRLGPGNGLAPLPSALQKLCSRIELPGHNYFSMKREVTLVLGPLNSGLQAN